ncbi:MAG: hypothetical protein E6J90_07740 [Deltaproteobacteria bacterium]|nr:MAG: hypothetical protein E6J91_13305 [Deltaproteobacteria bacterium]TMQ24560.1 MAG: hypothetical protein E6J90_07740 [Deltaproteobacteria bacterium]
MNTGMRAALRWLGTLVAALAILGVAAGCPVPMTITPRPPGTDGSARWAFGIAQPRIAAIAGDAELRTIIGSSVTLDGRLPANTGSWSFVAWSPTRSTIQVTVSFDGTTSAAQRNEAAPGPGIQVPMPASWADSIQVYAATSGHRGAGATFAQLAMLNVVSYAQTPGKATWGINFNAPPNQLVALDGTYIGPE